jgi:hypothetical protein
MYRPTPPFPVPLATPPVVAPVMIGIVVGWAVKSLWDAVVNDGDSDKAREIDHVQ